MRIADAIRDVSVAFLDTGPVIYFVEKNPQYNAVVRSFFDRIDQGVISAVTSPITLAECLIVPVRSNLTTLQQDYTQLITNGSNTTFATINHKAGLWAATLRAKYNIRLIDALQIGVALDMDCDAFLTNDAMLRRVVEINMIMVDDLEL
jgi:predicted nucleic acid-binding protein